MVETERTGTLIQRIKVPVSYDLLIKFSLLTS